MQAVMHPKGQISVFIVVVVFFCFILEYLIFIYENAWQIRKPKEPEDMWKISWFQNQINVHDASKKHNSLVTTW